MPELPEVERAARALRRAAVGRPLTGIRALHRSLRATLPPRKSRALLGRRLLEVRRVGKYQLLVFDGGAVLRVHFRMTGDWLIESSSAPLPKHARLVLLFEGQIRLSLDDSRALASVTKHPSLADALPDLGPEPDAPEFAVSPLRARLRGRRVAIKTALLDQRVVAGVGNIYACEALWHAGIDPRVAAGRLGPARLRRLVFAVRRVIRDAINRPGRYAEGEALERLAVYGRAGQPCRRCGSVIRRIVQGARGTWYCPGCQRR
jgi:formamidopyrimidine-DNA glycosylase